MVEPSVVADLKVGRINHQHSTLRSLTPLEHIIVHSTKPLTKSQTNLQKEEFFLSLDLFLAASQPWAALLCWLPPARGSASRGRQITFQSSQGM